GEPAGYQVAFGLACLLGLGATYTFTKFPDLDAGVTADAADASTDLSAAPAKPRRSAERGVQLGRHGRSGIRAILSELRKERSFAAFTGAGLLWTFAVNLPAPLFAVYFVN